MKPICPKCQRFYRPKKNGYYFLEMMPIGEGAQPGTATPEKWKPYKLWVGDLWECQGCGSEIVVGAPSSPIAEHYQPDFADKVKRLRANRLKVNDC